MRGTRANRRSLRSPTRPKARGETGRSSSPVAEIEAFLKRKWARELDYRLIKEVWAFHENRIAVRFAYEWHDDSGHWFRSYGNENWEFDEHGLMRVRIASINDLPIAASERSSSGLLAGGRTTIPD
jgi:nuclear transport factor 2 (NTF2) superfamily protein